MSKGTNKKGRQGKKGKRAKGKTHKWSLWSFLAGGLTLIGGLAAILAFLPRISVSVSEPVNLKNPLLASFTITNINFIPLSDVTASLGVGIIYGQPPPPSIVEKYRGSRFPSRLFRSEWSHHELSIDEKFTIRPADVLNIMEGPIANAVIAIIVEYKPWPLPIRREKIFRFEARPQSNGDLYWYSVPLD